MEVSSLCLDNRTQHAASSSSSSSPLGFYSGHAGSRGQGQGQGLPPSLYAHSSASTDTNVAVNRYLSAPVALQSWRREVLS